MKMLQRILVALMLAGAFLAMSAPAHAEVVWRTWGSCPFADKREDAMARFEEAIKDMSMPEEVKAEFRKLIVTNSAKGSERTVRPGDHFQEMQSCKNHLMKGGVKVGEYLDPQGKTQLGHTIQATEWYVDYQGKRYTLTLPDTCYNWAWEVSDIPRPKEEPHLSECYELRVPDVHAGDRMTLKVRAEGHTAPLPLCLPKKPAEWDSLPGCLECFSAKGPVVFLIPREVAEHYEITVCWEHEGKPSLKWVIESKDWVESKDSPNRFYIVPNLETEPPHPKDAGS